MSHLNHDRRECNHPEDRKHATETNLHLWKKRSQRSCLTTLQQFAVEIQHGPPDGSYDPRPPIYIMLELIRYKKRIRKASKSHDVEPRATVPFVTMNYSPSEKYSNARVSGIVRNKGLRNGAFYSFYALFLSLSLSLSLSLFMCALGPGDTHNPARLPFFFSPSSLLPSCSMRARWFLAS